MKRIHFYNTFEITVPIWNWLFPYLKKNNILPYAILSSGKYRKEKQSKIHASTKWIWVPSFFKDKKLFNHLFYILFAPFRILFNKADLNVFYTQPPFGLPILAFFSRLRGVPYVAHIMDYHPDLLLANGRLNKEGFLYRILDGMYLRALKKSKRVIVLGSCMELLFLSKGIAKEKIDTIQNISSVEDFKEKKSTVIQKFKEKYGAQNKLIILYAGNMGVAHEFRTMLSCTKFFKKEIQFFFAGKGKRRKEIEEILSENETDNITLFSYLPDDEFELILEVADFHFISLRKGFEGVMVPSKFYSSLAIGKPIIFEGNELSEVAQAILKYDCGLVVEHLNEAELKRKLSDLVQKKISVDALGDNSKKTYSKQFHSSTFNKKYLATLEKCFQ